MTMTKALIAGLLAGLLGLWGAIPAVAADEVNIETVPVRNGIYMLVGQGGNIGLFIGEDGTFLIDDQFAPLTEKHLAAIRAAGGDTPRFRSTPTTTPTTRGVTRTWARRGR